MSTGFEVRLEWGHVGLAAVGGAGPGTLIVVDVLSFSTAVSVAVERGALVFPYPWHDRGEDAYAAQHRAVLAGRRDDPSARFSLSPGSMLGAARGERIVLPSPNGSSLSFEALEYGVVLAGCLRNRTAIAERAASGDGPVAVIAAGERWPDGSIRFAAEDLLGAGAIISLLPGRPSPEAEIAAAAFERFHDRLPAVLRACDSGQELIGRGFLDDLEIAAELDVSEAVPMLVDACYR